MRHWRPEHKSSLPAPDDKYLEYEAAVYWGYRLHEWQAESVVNRARCVAHFVHAKMREGYESEQAGAKSKKKGSGNRSLSGLMAAMGI